MRDSLLIGKSGRVRTTICVSTRLAREAARRHDLAAGSAAALSQALTGALLLAASDGVRVDLQLDCHGPLRGFVADAEPTGDVRGLVRVNTLARAQPEARGRLDARPLLSSPHDERAGFLSVLRAQPGMESPSRAAFPFAGGDLGAALTLLLRSERERGGEVAIETLFDEQEPLLVVAGVLVEGDETRGKPLRQGGLRAALEQARDARALADVLFAPFEAESELEPRFACRCSRERVVRALRTLGARELLDMADKDGGAHMTCDFCGAQYAIPAEELRALAAGDGVSQP